MPATVENGGNADQKKLQSIVSVPHYKGSFTPHPARHGTRSVRRADTASGVKEPI